MTENVGGGWQNSLLLYCLMSTSADMIMYRLGALINCRRARKNVDRDKSDRSWYRREDRLVRNVSLGWSRRHLHSGAVLWECCHWTHRDTTRPFGIAESIQFTLKMSPLTRPDWQFSWDHHGVRTLSAVCYVPPGIMSNYLMVSGKTTSYGSWKVF
jgi:hypothetical protein